MTRTNRRLTMQKTEILLKWLLVLAWIGLIFSFTLQTAETSSDVSSGLLMSLINGMRYVYPNIENVVDLDVMHTLLRSGAHFGLYFILGIFTANAVTSFFVRPLSVIGVSTGFSSFVGMLDEVTQYFVPGRAMMLSDIVIDGVGALFGSLFLVGILVFLKSTTGKANECSDNYGG